jgi:two-component system response regulator DevR
VASYVSKYLRVFLVDDHDIVRRGLRDLLAPSMDIQVVGDAGSARQAVPAILELGVDVMLLDLRLQDGTGIDVCREVRAVDSSISGLLLTSSDDDEALTASILAGAAGYLVKLTNSSDVATAIRRVGSGKSLIDVATVERTTQRLLTAIDELRPEPTEDERRILTDVLQGLTNDQIADRMEVPLETMHSRISGLVHRLLHPAPGQISSPALGSRGRHRRDS